MKGVTKMKNKNKIKIVLSTGSVIALKVIEVNLGLELPLASYIVPPIVSIMLVEKIYKSIYRQIKKSPVISSLKAIRDNHRNKNYAGKLLFNTILAGIVFYVYDKHIDVLVLNNNNIVPNFNKYIYTITPILGYCLTLVQVIKHKNKLLNYIQYKANEKGLYVVDIDNNKTTVMSNKLITNMDIPMLETVVNHDISSIKQDKNIRNKYYLIEGNNDYRQLEKGSLSRLEQILINLKDKPIFISTSEDDVSITHKYISLIPIKKLLSLQQEVEHKIGSGKNTLIITNRDGYVYFSISKNNDKTYVLDDYIPKTTVRNKELGFILGINPTTNNIVVEDLTKLKHLLIAGKTGSGKSCTFKGIIESLMYYNDNIIWYMLDFADSALTKYQKFYNVKYVESEIPEINKALEQLLVEYNKRKKTFRENEVENIQEYNSKVNSKLPYVIFAIDEANAFKSEMDNKEFTSMEKSIKTLLQRGRKYGMLIIMAVQQTNDRDFVKSWKTQFTRIAHLLEDNIDCQNITTKKEYQTLIPSLKTGEFYVLSESENYKMKACLTDNKHNELYKILKKGYILDDKKDNNEIHQEFTKFN
jgi:hypothetical protein